MRKILSLNIVVVLLLIQMCSAAHYIVGYVENAKDGTSPNGKSVILWNPEIGIEVLDRAISELSDVSKMEREKRFEGRRIITILAPEKKGQNDKEKSQEISS